MNTDGLYDIKKWYSVSEIPFMRAAYEEFRKRSGSEQHAEYPTLESSFDPPYDVSFDPTFDATFEQY
ncbi:hypothetical protein PCCS19_05890 [Paenibacillus sp. CCS19]|uniref:hypothetical protein n=1 Tax=Paenibacillus sp. CCS19 TaxID=3158387 RepID=UPI00256D97DA|nr:hypothetical protein [Paenibacillus cellulosilyticus]GMK37535.1 hypothetical protein PCCS19_05890 [Paenibacillus cellulosilyticus]